MNPCGIHRCRGLAGGCGCDWRGRPGGRAAGAVWAVDDGGGRLIWSACGGGVAVMPKGIYGIAVCVVYCSGCGCYENA